MSPDSFDSAVVHNTSSHRFELRLEGGLAFASYQSEGGTIVFDHTFVPVALRGKGVAATVVRAALNEARRQHWKIVPRCSYVAAFIERNPAYGDLIKRSG